jgi:hypothetical protein
MRSDSVRRLIDAHGPFRERIDCESATPDRWTTADLFRRAGGLVLVEALLAHSGLLDRPGVWTVRVRGAVAVSANAAAVAIKEAAATTVRLVLRPATDAPAFDCQLLVYRDKGDPEAVRRTLRDLVTRLGADEPTGPPSTQNSVAVVQGHPSVKGPTPLPSESPAPERLVDVEVHAHVGDWAYLRLLLEAVDAAASATHLPQFVRSVALEFGPQSNFRVWAEKLAAFARAGILSEQTGPAGLVGYRVTTAGRNRLAELGGPEPGPSISKRASELDRV